MSEQNPPSDPFEFLKKMWGPMGNSLPGMVTPTLDVNEIDKRIGELKSVETWLGMNLNMLKMTIQGLEMQRATLAAFQSMGAAGQQAATPPDSVATPSTGVAPWPWNLMPQSAPPTKTQAEADAPKDGESDAKQ
jgi:hypothetical protein